MECVPTAPIRASSHSLTPPFSPLPWPLCSSLQCCSPLAPPPWLLLLPNELFMYGEGEDDQLHWGSRDRRASCDRRKRSCRARTPGSDAAPGVEASPHLGTHACLVMTPSTVSSQQSAAHLLAHPEEVEAGWGVEGVVNSTWMSPRLQRNTVRQRLDSCRRSTSCWSCSSWAARSLAIADLLPRSFRRWQR
jgi:hypothetical protein